MSAQTSRLELVKIEKEGPSSLCTMRDVRFEKPMTSSFKGLEQLEALGGDASGTFGMLAIEMAKEASVVRFTNL